MLMSLQWQEKCPDCYKLLILAVYFVASVSLSGDYHAYYYILGGICCAYCFLTYGAQALPGIGDGSGA